MQKMKQCKREKQHDRAIELLFKLENAVEKETKEADWVIVPWYQES